MIFFQLLMHFGPSGKVGRFNVLFPITYCIYTSTPSSHCKLSKRSESALKHVLIYALYS